MSIDTTSLSELDPEEVAERKEVLTALLSEENPELDYSEGSVNQQLIIQPNAEIDAMQRRNIDRVRQSNSLLAIEEDPTLADDGIVEKTLSNFMITRKVGTNSGGSIILVLTASTGFIVPVTTGFTSGSRTFFPTVRFNVVTNSNLVLASEDRLLRLRDDGKFWVIIEVVEAVEAGASIVEGSPLVMAPAVSSLESVNTAEDFPQGTPTETNAEMLARLEEGTAFQTIADRKSILATLTTQFSSIVDSRFVGLGDDEAIRDTTHILGINSGGKGDFYLRTTLAPVRTKVTVLGNYTGVSTFREGVGGYSGFFKNYQLPVGIDEIAGFLTTSRVTYYNPSSLALPFEFSEGATVMGFDESVLRGIRSVNEPFSPDIIDEAHATYSRYQSGGDISILQDIPPADYATIFAQTLVGLDPAELIPVVVASDEIKNLTVQELTDLVASSSDSIRVYDAYLFTVPDIIAIQDYLNLRDNRPPGADYLAKAPIPCFTSASLTVNYQTTGAVPDEQTIQDAASVAINQHVFGSDLTALEISIAVQAVLPSTAQVVLPIALAGELRQIDGTITSLTGTSSLVIPSTPSLGSTNNTVGYFATPDDITVTLVAV